MEKKKQPSLSESRSPKNTLRVPFDLVDDYQENKKGVTNLAVVDEQLPKDAQGQTPDLVWNDPPAFRRELLVKAMRDIEMTTVSAESSEGNDARQQRIELLVKKIAEAFDCSEERAAGIVKEALAQRNINQTLDAMFDNVSEFQEIRVINGTPPKLIPPASGIMWINLVDPVTGELIKKEDLAKTLHDVDLEEAYPGTRKTNPELYSESFVADYRKMYTTKPSDGPQPLTEDFDPETFHQMYALKSSLTIPDKWFFYRNHQFHDVHHKRRKAHFDEIALILLRHGWTQYKETLHKKKYHIFDKTPRAKAERLALKRSREKIKPTLMVS